MSYIIIKDFFIKYKLQNFILKEKADDITDN